jgi:hypothetical protein
MAKSRTDGDPERPPSSQDMYNRMVASGELIPAERPLGEWLLWEPLAGKPGFSASEELQWQREDRFDQW